MESDELTLDADEEQEAKSTGCFSTVKKGRFVPFLELRFFDGDSLGLRYTHVHPISFNKSKGITIDAAPVRVLIKGRNLKGLWRYLLQESVVWIKELPESMDDKEAAETVVYSIDVVSEPPEVEEREENEAQA